MQEREIIQAAIQRLHQLTGIDIQEVLPPAKSSKLPRQPDSFIKIETEGKRFNFWVEAKNELRHEHLPRLIETIGKDTESWLLVCQYVSKQIKAILQERGVNYLDASGNCYIKKGSLFLFINDQKVSAQRTPGGGKLWKASGLQLLFSVLLNPEILNETYRQIATESKLSLGSIAALMQELEKEKYFSHYNNTYRLENREALLNRWIETFQSILRPKLIQGKFQFASTKDRDNWKNVQLNKAFWGGEPAGALLTKYLRPEKFSIYTENSKLDVMKELHLVPAENGEVELLKPFWNTEETRKEFPQTVPPLLAYAELQASLDSRNRETAERIKKQYHV